MSPTRLCPLLFIQWLITATLGISLPIHSSPFPPHFPPPQPTLFTTPNFASTLQERRWVLIQQMKGIGEGLGGREVETVIHTQLDPPNQQDRNPILPLTAEPHQGPGALALPLHLHLPPLPGRAARKQVLSPHLDRGRDRRSCASQGLEQCGPHCPSPPSCRGGVELSPSPAWAERWGAGDAKACGRGR